MASKDDNPVWLLIIWLGGAGLGAGYGLWGIYDGWINPIKDIAFNQWVATPGGFAVALFCVWRGVKEYRAIKSGTRGQGGESPQEGSSASIADDKPQDDTKS